MAETKKRLRISREEALKLLLELAKTPQAETVELASCFGRVLAEDFISPEMVPPFPKSPLDGYAFRAEDTAGASADKPVVLRITEEIAAGYAPKKPVQSGEAAKILTGGAIPAGANAVVRFEETEFTAATVSILEPVEPNTNIVPEGDDIKRGQLIAKKGETITPPIAGLLAAVGRESVSVYKKPRITVISTGSELTRPGVPLEYGKIRNSSYTLLKGYMEQAGAAVDTLGIVPDDVDVIARAIDSALEASDMVVTTGGVSMGDYDYILAATEKIGARRLFWKVRFRPGGTMLAAEKNGKLILGLSGNPASASLALHLLGLPFIGALCGRPGLPPPRAKARLITPIHKSSPNGRLVRGRMEFQSGELCFRGVDAQGNGALTSLLGCNLIADIPPDTPPLPAGVMVDVYVIW